MKGSNEATVLLVSVVAALLLIVAILGLQSKISGNSGIYEAFSKPIIVGSEKITQAAAGKYLSKCRKFLEEVEQVFRDDPIEGRCSRWYVDCTGDSSSPWNNKVNVQESDYEAVYALRPDCGKEARAEIESSWIKAHPEFKEYSDQKKYELIKNACQIVLLNMIHEGISAQNH